MTKTFDYSTAKALFVDAIARARAQDWRGAGQRFADAWRTAPDRPQAAQGLLECAARLAQSAPAPARQRSGVRPACGLISFVVCSIEPAKLARLRADIARNFAAGAHELVHVGDARALGEGYQRGLAAARGDWIVFCHDDIGIVATEFSARLRERLAEFDLIGVAGSNRLSGPAWHHAGPPHTASWVCQPQPTGGILCGLLGTRALLRDAQALDGVFLAGRRDTFEQLRFDDATFDGFHFYDLDLSYRAHRAGLRCAAALDLVIWHESGGRFGDQWRGYAQRFLGKFPELTPASAAAPFRTGAYPVAGPGIAARLYGWVEHWLGQPAGG